MRTLILANLPLQGYMVCYIGNTNPDMSVEDRVSWWIVPGTLVMED